MIVLLRFARVAACALGVLFTGAAAVAAYPDKPIWMLVPYPPGGITDVLTRSLAELMRKERGQQVIVENKPGANTALAAQTPAAIVARLNAAVALAVRDPAFRAQFEAVGLVVPAPIDPAAFARFIQAETAKWAPLIKAKNITLE